jgi:spore germination protein KB
MKVQISNGMFMALVINMVYAKAIGLTQGIMAREVNGDMWISTIMATAQGVLIMLLTAWALQRTPQQSMFEQSSEFFGKWMGKLVSLIVFVFFVGTFGAISITFVYHLMDYFLPEAPILLFIIVMLIVGDYAIYHGLEVVSRMALVGVFSILMLNILLLIGSFSFFDIRELLPVLGSGLWNTVWASRHNDTDWAMATMMAAVILPMVKHKKVWPKAGAAGIIYGGLFILMWPILEAGVLSSEVTAQYIVACMQMARSAEIGHFIHRYEMIMVAFFAISLLVQIMMSLLCASHAASHLFGLKDFRPTIIPVSLILGAFGYWIVFSHQRAMVFLTDYWPPIAMPIAFGLPVLLWGLGWFMKKKWTGEKGVG